MSTIDTPMNSTLSRPGSAIALSLALIALFVTCAELGWARRLPAHLEQARLE